MEKGKKGKKDKVANVAKDIYELRARLEILWNLIAKYDKAQGRKTAKLVSILQEEMKGIHSLEATIKRKVDDLF